MTILPPGSRWEKAMLIAGIAVNIAAICALAQSSGNPHRPTDVQFKSNRFPFPLSRRPTHLADGSWVVVPTNTPGTLFYASRGNPLKWRLVQPILAGMGEPIDQPTHVVRNLKCVGGQYGHWYFLAVRRRATGFRQRWIMACNRRGKVTWLKSLPPWQRARFASAKMGVASIKGNLIATCNAGAAWQPSRPFINQLYHRPYTAVRSIHYVGNRYFLVILSPRGTAMVRLDKSGNIKKLWTKEFTANQQWEQYVGAGDGVFWMAETGTVWSGWRVKGGRPMDSFSITTGVPVAHYSLGSMERKLSPVLGGPKGADLKISLLGGRFFFVHEGTGFAIASPADGGRFNVTSVTRAAGAWSLLPGNNGKIDILTAPGRISLSGLGGKAVTPESFMIQGRPYIDKTPWLPTARQARQVVELLRGIPDAELGKLNAEAITKFANASPAKRTEFMISRLRALHKKLGIPLQKLPRLHSKLIARLTRGLPASAIYKIYKDAPQPGGTAAIRARIAYVIHHLRDMHKTFGIPIAPDTPQQTSR